MAIPSLVRYWLNLRKEYERRARKDPNAMPVILPVVRIGKKWYFEDERLMLHELVQFVEVLRGLSAASRRSECLERAGIQAYRLPA